MMKKYITTFCILLTIGILPSCELFDAPDDTANVQERLINFPDVVVLGEPFLVFDIREENPVYEDAGASATFAGVDITDEIVTDGVEAVDSNVGGFYDITYSVTRTNSLDQEVSATQSRTVVVTNPDDDLSGSWTLSTENLGWRNTNTNVAPAPQILTTLGVARFQIPAYFNGGLGSNELDRSVELRIAGDIIIVPPHGSQFGIFWAGNGEVVSRDPVTDQVTEFNFEWFSSSGFNGGAVFARNTYTRN